MSRTIHVKHVASGNMFLWLHKNSSSPRDTTFFSVVDEGSGLMYPCYFSLEPANPLEYLSLILSAYLGTWWIDHLGDTYGHLYNRTVWRSWRRVRSPFLDHEFRVPCWSHRLEHPVLADQQILILAQVDSGWKHHDNNVHLPKQSHLHLWVYLGDYWHYRGCWWLESWLKIS